MPRSCSRPTHSASACRSSRSASRSAVSPHPCAWVKRHSRALTLVSAAVLAVFGLILLTDSLPTVTARLSDAMDSLGLRGLVELG